LSSTVTIARVAGVEIGINWTWIAVFALFLWSLAGVEFPAAAPGRSVWVYTAMGVTATACFFTSLVLHELGHALQARRDGVRIEGITLWLFGGVAKFVGRFPSAGAEFRIAVAGPLVTLTLGICFSAAAGIWPQPGAVRAVLLWLAYINLALLVFNLLPAMPLDGGRVLRSALWARSGNLTSATHRATRIGGILSALMIGAGLVTVLYGGLGGLWLALIGWFVLEAGRAEERDIVLHDALRATTVASLMTLDPSTVDVEESLDEMAARLQGTPRHTAYPVIDAAGGVVGLIPLTALADVPHAEWAIWTVDDCMTPAEEVVHLSPSTPAGAALDLLVESGPGRAVVIDSDRLVGILSLTDLARAVAEHAGYPLATSVLR
jgi:Zn-dependent protease/CBS domain-containing protein